MWLPIRGTSDMTEATHFSQCVHDQQRRLEAEDCYSIRCAQLISGGRRRIRPPCTVPRSRSPHNVLYSPSNYNIILIANRCDGHKYIYRKCRVEVTSVGSLTLAQLYSLIASDTPLWRREHKHGALDDEPPSV